MKGDNNWTKDETVKEYRKKAVKVLDDLKKDKYSEEKKYRLVKVSDHPLTFKEVPFDDD